MTSYSRREVLGAGFAVGSVTIAGCVGFGPGDGCQDGRTLHERDAPPVPDASWPMRQRDAGRTAFAPEASVPSEVSAYWRYTSCTAVDAGATIANGRVYPGRASIDAATGQHVWGGWSSYQQPAVVDGTLYVGSHELEAYDAADGSELWTFDPVGGAGAVSPPAVHDGLAYVTGNINDRRVYAVDTATGDEEWRFMPVADCDEPIAAGEDAVYAVDDVGLVYALDAATGEKRWEADLDAAVNGPPAVDDGTVYAATADGFVFALGAADGAEQWRWQAARGAVRSIAVTDETVVVVSPDAVHAVAKPDARELWHTKSVGGSVCSVGPDTVVVGDGRGVTALSRDDDGAELWTFETRSVSFGDHDRAGVSIAPALVDDLVVVTTEASDVYVLGAPE